MKLLLIFTILLGGCTIARYGDSFEKHATHIEKDYNKPFEELYTCLMASGTMTSQQSTYSTSSMAVYEFTGFTKVVLKQATKNKTHVRVSAILPYYKPQAYIDTLDQCAGEQEKWIKKLLESVRYATTSAFLKNAVQGGLN